MDVVGRVRAVRAWPLRWKVALAVVLAVWAAGGKRVLRGVLAGLLAGLRWYIESASQGRYLAWYGKDEALARSSVDLLALRALLSATKCIEPPPTLFLWQQSLKTLPLLLPRGREVVEAVTIRPGVPAWRVTHPGAGASPYIIVYFHGGAYLGGSARTYLPFLGCTARETGVPSLAVDYRLVVHGSTIHNAIHDCVAAVDHAVTNLGYAPGRVIVMGDSAGGGLVLSVIQRLLQLGKPAPCCGIAISPWADATCTQGASHKDNAGLDPLITPAHTALFRETLSAPHPDLAIPELSPLNGSFENFPPLCITAAARESLASDASLVAHKARAAGVAVDLHVADTYGLHIDPVFSPCYPEAAGTHHAINNYIRRMVQPPSAA
eukprot:TRINITY_DN23059_c0_g1_i1.p2 TRINITY_DN23059_c0_g1~~TRINITY_DN23059_c0_g1_i1.p2  ORF type:complete len:379 (+),score=75.36 TRINITY_DN23059_c0_g1_i1:37-1173(+)